MAYLPICYYHYKHKQSGSSMIGFLFFAFVFVNYILRFSSSSTLVYVSI